ncbi:MAG: cytochrome c3 family protein, partial [Carboxydocellales bacterium]
MHKSLDDASYNYLTCTDCHNPHGEKQTGNELYPKLLRSTDGSGTKYVQGNQFCLACHGKDDQGYENTSYYNLTGGNHNNPLDPTNINAAKTPGPAHYDNTSFPLLNPASGTQITCLQCHDSHGSKFGKLLDNSSSNSEEQVCLKCHNSTTTSMNGRNIQSEFALAGSTHDILGTQSSKVECTSCHGPHTVAKADISAGGTTSQVSDPDNTKKFLAPTAGINTNAGDISDFCLRCHDGTPPTATTTFNQVVPFTINFPATSFSNNNGGWNKSSYKSAGHYTGGQLNCASCHASHGSAYPSLLKYAEDSDTVNGVCLRCHGGATGSPAGAKNVKPDLTKTGSPSPDRYRHPTLYISGKHSNTENYNNLPLTSRH